MILAHGSSQSNTDFSIYIIVPAVGECSGDTHTPLAHTTHTINSYHTHTPLAHTTHTIIPLVGCCDRLCWLLLVGQVRECDSRLRLGLAEKDRACFVIGQVATQLLKHDVLIERGLGLKKIRLGWRREHVVQAH